MQNSLRNYLCVTAAYWADTLTDGALRMLVLFHFYQQGYTAWQVASLFLFYEIFGIITNLVGGWLGARLGLKTTLFLGLGTQLAALAMLALVPLSGLTVAWVMASQALSGIAKDLTKMSSKSAVKLVAGDSDGTLFKWVAILTGSKNALKGVGFFLGGFLLSAVGFQASLQWLGGLVLASFLGAALLMRGGIGEASKKARFGQMFSSNRSVNLLAAARVTLFAARDVWFVVALPVFLSSVLGWKFWQTGTFMALWVIGYGIIQAATPLLFRGKKADGRAAVLFSGVLACIPASMALLLVKMPTLPAGHLVPGGLILFGVLFALNSSLHSYLILAYAESKKVAQSVGFYYMANACGRLLGTVLSGYLYSLGGLPHCLWASAWLLLATAIVSVKLPRGKAEASLAG